MEEGGFQREEWAKTREWDQAVVAQAFKPGAGEAEAGRTLGPVWSRE